jgi:two-component system sensor histidine kinase AlgZ
LLDRRNLLKGGVAIAVVASALTAMMANFGRVGTATFAVLCLVSLCFAAAYRVASVLVNRFVEQRSPPLLGRAFLDAAAIVAAAAVGGEAATRVLLAVGWSSAADLSALRLRVVSIGLAVLVGIRLTELGYERLREQIRSVELRAERARRQALHAELAALRARTDPHFLFNSLNTIAGLIEEDPQRAVEVVSRLSALFRHTVQGSRVESVSLGDEIQAVSAFLEIQALRFEDGLSWSVAVPEELENAQVPPLILQPLVENAVLHGSSQGRRSRVEIEAGANGASLVLTVTDHGPGPGRSKHRGSGTSLADLEERLALLFGPAGRVESGPAPEGGFRVALRLPLAQRLAPQSGPISPPGGAP